MKTCINKLKSCRTFAEAEKILETAGAGKASKELLRLGFAVKEKQPDIFENNLQTVIQEIEDDEEEKKKDMDTQEVDGGESHDSTTTGELPQVADIAPHADTEGMNSVTDTKDQMGAIVNEAHSGMNSIPPMQPPGGMPNPMQQAGNGMYPGCPPMAGQPQMPPQQNAMQYTMNQVHALANQMKAMQEAIQTINKKVQEIAKPAPQTLDIAKDTLRPAAAKPLKETTDKGVSLNDVKLSKRAKLENRHREITSFNNYLNDKGSSSNKNPGVQ